MHARAMVELAETALNLTALLTHADVCSALRNNAAFMEDVCRVVTRHTLVAERYAKLLERVKHGKCDEREARIIVASVVTDLLAELVNELLWHHS